MAARSTTSDDFAALQRRMDVIIYLLLHRGDPAQTVTEKIAVLGDTALSDAEVGAIVGRKANYVAATRSRLRKQTKK